MQTLPPDIPLAPKAKSNLFCKLGFSFAIAVFIWICSCYIIAINCAPRAFEVIMLLVLLSFYVVPIFWILALVFSIVGLNKANKNGSPKWMGKVGIIICILNVLSFLFPFIYAGFIFSRHSSRVVETTIPAPRQLDYGESIYSDRNPEIEIKIYKNGRIFCYDYKAEGTRRSLSIPRSEKDLSALREWLNDMGESRLKKLRNSDGKNIIIRAHKENEYKRAEQVLDIMNSAGLNKFQLKPI